MQQEAVEVGEHIPSSSVLETGVDVQQHRKLWTSTILKRSQSSQRGLEDWADMYKDIAQHIKREV